MGERSPLQPLLFPSTCPFAFHISNQRKPSFVLPTPRSRKLRHSLNTGLYLPPLECIKPRHGTSLLTPLTESLSLSYLQSLSYNKITLEGMLSG